ncbi:MAG: UPF0489 family protein [Raineya sp.]|jgi:hypothetical protein|nr:UPF0489 family protein [Raineya sp.]
MDKFHEISHRSNIIHKKYTFEHLGKKAEKDVVIYEDHRTILNILYWLKQTRYINTSIDLITFDRHTDFCDISPETIKKISKPNLTFQQLYQIVEFELNPLDDDWIKAGMEANLINNCFLLSAENLDEPFLQEYKTKKWGKKKYYYLGDVWYLFDYKQVLNDPLNEGCKEFWESFGWNFDYKSSKFIDNRHPFVLDFDLDCFSTEIMTKNIAIPEELLQDSFNKNINNYNFNSVRHFLKYLIEESQIVTICIENSYCGGIRQAQRIFNAIDYLLFDGELGK